MDAFSTEQVCRLSGASPRQLDHWARLAVFTPSVQEANGSGSQRRYSLRDVEIARVLVRLSLVLQGGTLTRFAGLVQELRTNEQTWHRQVLVRIDGGTDQGWDQGDGCLLDPRAARAHVAAELQGLRAEERVKVLVG